MFAVISILLGTTFAFPLARAFPDLSLLPPLVILVAMLVAGWVMTKFVNGKPFGAIGLSFHPAMFRELGIGVLIGFAMILGVFLAEVISGCLSVSWRGLTPVSVVRVLILSFITFGIGVVAEEVAFRGYLFQTMIQAVTFLPATVLMAILFALVHRLNPGITWLGLVNVGIAGVWLSIAYMKTRSLWLPIGLHWAWNFSQTTMFGLPTSGIDGASFRLLDVVQRGPEWVTGGVFGPEGGVLVTLSLIIGTGVVLKVRSLRAPEGIITLDSIEDLLGPQNGSGEAPK